MNELYEWQDELWQRWIELRARLPHAILLKGPQGIGKLDFAINLARALLCKKSLGSQLACLDCASCRWFEQGTHPDFRLLLSGAHSIEMQESNETQASLTLKNWTKRIAEEVLDEQQKKGKKPSKEISIHQVRSLANFVNLSTHQGGPRVVLIYPAETMNTNAANALLKMLEEPPEQMLIILVSHKPQQLLPTIVSRCLALTAPMPALETSSTWLQQRKYTNPVATLARAGFAPLLAARLAEEAIGESEYSLFLQEIRQPAQFDVFVLAEQLQRVEPIHVIHWLQQWCYDLGSAKLTGKVRYHPYLFDLIKNLSDNIAMFNLLRYQNELIIAKREALHPLNPKLLFESILLSYRHMMLEANV
ncbi:DNA polymerase III subunit delta' [Candidatus Nitrotoga sp. HW29]|uniref:DNA polymerase III subunit delta' n=1 Tax=Candidatus Nitrotoga sp. HW29 TaxID=2886963 RepID=UPI001EF1F3BF|nr:DNA polymerase III subunit delta' [Candidatus Nitrotoga sp. HW29]CAH1905876.1 DNA polymerase III subunit delta' [Candidatus Nitrotoga sp. HW29]